MGYNFLQHQLIYKLTNQILFGVNNILNSTSPYQLTVQLYNIGLGQAVFAGSSSDAILTTSTSGISIINGNSTYNGTSCSNCINGISSPSSNFGTNTSIFTFNAPSGYNGTTFNLLVKDAYNQTWPFTIDLSTLSCTTCSSCISNITSSGYTNSIEIDWSCSLPNIVGYNLYMEDPSGLYHLLNSDLIPYTFYLDGFDWQGHTLQQTTLYNYELTAVDNNGNESSPPCTFSASTAYPFEFGWPVIPNQTPTTGYSILGRYYGSPITYDWFNDGNKEIFFTSGARSTATGGVWAYNSNGTAINNIDPVTTIENGYINVNASTYSTPAIGDIDGTNELSVTTNDNATSSSSKDQTLFGYNVPATSNITPSPSFFYSTSKGYDILNGGAVYSDIDGSGNTEILFSNFSNTNTGGTNPIENPDGGVEMVNSSGSTYSSNWPITGYNCGWTMPVAFDFDNGRYGGKKEIVFGTTGTYSHQPAGIYIYRDDGTPYPRSTSPEPIFTPPAGYRCDFPPVVADIDHDGIYEIIFICANGNTANIYAMKPNGLLVPGWDNTNHPFFYINSSVGTSTVNADLSSDIWLGQTCPTLAVGDIYKDGHLYVVCGDNGTEYVWDNTGTKVSTFSIPTYAPGAAVTYEAPIIADVSGDGNDLQVIVSDNNNTPQGSIYAFNINNAIGNLAPGFPMTLLNNGDVLTNSPCVDDIDKDGYNELIVSTSGEFDVWKTNGSVYNNQYGWTSYRHDANNSGVFCKSDLWMQDILQIMAQNRTTRQTMQEEICG